METPFEIGHTYFLPHHNPTQVSVPCPVCYGNKKVIVILGNGEHVYVECEGCGIGFEGPRGYVMEYRYDPFVSEFTVKEIHSMYSGEWTLKSTTGQTANWTQLYTDYNAAMAEAEKTMKECIDRNMRDSIGRTKHQREQKCWTIAYHEKCIKDWEKKIEWHRSKVSERRKCL